MKKLTTLIAVTSFLILTGCISEKINNPPPDINPDEIKNSTVPQAKYCQLLGYEYETGNCIFPNGKNCSDWSFFRGECGQEFSYCDRMGYKIKNITDNMGTWTASYAVCFFNDGSECYEKDHISGECKISECKKWRMSENGCIK